MFTGHSPSLDVLARLAELYGCSIADLLSDCADFRNSDELHHDAQYLAALPALLAEEDTRTSEMGTAGRNANAPDPLTNDRLLERLHDIDVHELARLVASWAERIGGTVSRRRLLLKLSASLSLAAASPALTADAASAHTATVASEAGGLSGIWQSRYYYHSSGRNQDLVGEHYVRLRHDSDRLTGESVPASNGSVLRLDLTLSGPIATGTWSERTSPDGYYRGAVYHGAIQLALDPLGKSMRGRWLGFDRNSNINNDIWELTWVEAATSKGSQRKYHRKA